MEGRRRVAADALLRWQQWRVVITLNIDELILLALNIVVVGIEEHDRVCVCASLNVRVNEKSKETSVRK